MRSSSISNNNFLLLLLISLSSINFFNPLFLADLGFNIYGYIFSIFLCIAVPYNIKYILSKRRDLFSLPVKLLFIAITGAVLSATFIRDQSIIYSVFATIFPLGGYFFFFLLIYKSPSINIIEKLITNLGILYILLFAVSYLIYPAKFLSFQEFTDDNRGGNRVILNGLGFLFLFFFFSLTKISKTSPSLKWVFLSAISYLCILLTLERLYILSTTLISVIYLLRRQKLYLKILSSAFISIIFVGVLNLNVTQKLYEKSSNELSNYKEYIRFQAAEYYLTNFQKSTATRIFGNGFGYGNKSNYGRELISLEDASYWIEDLGFIGLYIYAGISALIAFFLIYFKLFKNHSADGYEYPKLFMIFLLLNGFTNYGTYNQNFVICIVLSLFVFQKTTSLSLTR